MGQYKVPQDVEAEDKIFGPLTLKQFIYTVAGVICAFASWVLFHGFIPLMLIVGAPPTVLLLLLGLYRRQDQPFEAYFLSLVSFIGRPRQRIWTKEPILEAFKVEPAVAVAAPVARDSGQIRSRLEQLAQVVDTRGWAAKESALSEPIVSGPDLSDRLYLPEAAASDAVAAEIKPADDILDLNQNPAAQQIDALIQNHTKVVRDEAMAKMRQPVPIAPGIHDIKGEHPVATPAAPPPAVASTSDMTPNPFNAILKLAMEENGLTVSQIAARANQAVLSEGQSVSVRNATQPQPASTST